MCFSNLVWVAEAVATAMVVVAQAVALTAGLWDDDRDGGCIVGVVWRRRQRQGKPTVGRRRRRRHETAEGGRRRQEAVRRIGQREEMIGCVWRGVDR